MTANCITKFGGLRAVVAVVLFAALALLAAFSVLLCYARVARRHTLLPLYGEALSSPSHDVLLPAIGKREYHMLGVLALVAVCQQSEEGQRHVLHRERVSPVP
jgi:hypothetical protein